LVGGELKENEIEGPRETAWFVLVSEVVGGEVKENETEGPRDTARFVLVSQW
jgi:hypothetical protein